MSEKYFEIMNHHSRYNFLARWKKLIQQACSRVNTAPLCGAVWARLKGAVYAAPFRHSGRGGSEPQASVGRGNRRFPLRVDSQKLRLIVQHSRIKELVPVALLTLFQPILEFCKLSVLLALIHVVFHAEAPVIPLLTKIGSTWNFSGWFAAIPGGFVGFLIAMFILLALIQSSFDLYLLKVSEQTRHQIVERLRMTAIDRLMRLDLEFFSRSHPGDLIFTFHGAIEKAGIIVDLLAQMVRSLLTLSILWLLMQSLSLTLAIMVLGVGAVAWILLVQFVQKTKEASIHLTRTTREAMTKLHDIVYGIRLIKTAGMEQTERQSYLDTCQRLFLPQLRLLLARYSTTAATQCIGLLIVLVGVGYALLQGLTGQTFPAFVLSYLVLLRQAAPHIIQLNDLRFQIAHADGYLNYVVDLMSQPVHEIAAPGAMPADLSFLSSGESTRRLQLRVEGLTFGYGNRPPAVRNVTFTCEQGEAIAIVGLSGAGKSTLLDLLGRFRHPQEGRVCLNDIDIRAIDFVTYRKLVGSTSQEPILFNRTVVENIRYGLPHKTDEDVEQAARKAQAHEFIMRMPQGYETELGERGLHVSGGERQRIALARLLLQDPSIMLIDEATSWLDVQTEMAVLDSLFERHDEKILVMVSHRLTSLHRFDQIVVLQGGSIIAQGAADILDDGRGLPHVLAKTIAA